MEHVGEIVEKVVRRSGLSITDLALRLHVNRKSIYKWFAQRYLSFDIVLQIGCVMGHDFTIEFPDRAEELSNADDVSESESEVENAEYWREKYIELLEKYVDQLESEQNIPQQKQSKYQIELKAS